MEEDSKKWLYWVIPAVVAVGIGVALYYGRSQRQAQEQQQTATEVAPAPAEPAIQHPLQEQAKPEDLPTLAESDPAVQSSLNEVFGRAIEPILVPQNIIRHTVVTIDNLPRKKTAVQMWPVKPIGSELATGGTAEELTLSASNYARYEPFVKLLQNADTGQIVALYKRYYPLFQQAYVDLGYPEGYFNDRLVAVIDHLLATPEVQGPVRLQRPSVHYEFADADLENRSAGQKLLIRMGSANAAVVKAKLRELREAVTKKQ